MLKKFSEFIEEGMWGSALRRSNTSEERREDKDNTQYIDLGLPSGTLWADRNIGAAEPEEYGDFYAWGETEPKKEYTWNTYKWDVYCTKYNKKDGKTVLEPEDDVVYLKTKGVAHIPTIEQIHELLNNTTSKYKTINGIVGRLYKSKVNGNTIFIPFAGNCDVSSITGINRFSRYWSSSLYSPNHQMTYYLYAIYDNSVIFVKDRYVGLSVRGVKDK